jgi:hypothetical protein
VTIITTFGGDDLASYMSKEIRYVAIRCLAATCHRFLAHTTQPSALSASVLWDPMLRDIWLVDGSMQWLANLTFSEDMDMSVSALDLVSMLSTFRDAFLALAACQIRLSHERTVLPFLDAISHIVLDSALQRAPREAALKVLQRVSMKIAYGALLSIEHVFNLGSDCIMQS